MRIVVGADHAGYPLKVEVVRFLEEQGHEVTDLGTHSTDPVDFPVYARQVGKRYNSARRIEAYWFAAVAWGLVSRPTSCAVFGQLFAMTPTRRIKVLNMTMLMCSAWVGGS